MKFKLATENDEDVTVTSEISFNGRVWIGDPCYIIRNEDWGKFLDVFRKGDDSDGVIVNTTHGNVFVFNTVHGDGEYPVYRDRKEIGVCGVDAGLLCIMYADTAYKLRRNKKEVERLGVFVDDVNGNPVVSGGDCEIGDVLIVTGDEE